MRTSTIVFCLIMLVSCGKKNTKPTTSLNNWQQVSHWSFVGKMAINTGQESGSGKVQWKVSDKGSRAKFKAPLGQGSWEILEEGNNAQLISSRNGESFANNAEELIANELGWYFPWNNLHYWLRGFTPDDKLTIDKELPETLNYDGWEITYQKWMQTPIGMLPKKIKVTKEAYTVKLIIYEWDIK